MKIYIKIFFSFFYKLKSLLLMNKINNKGNKYRLPLFFYKSKTIMNGIKNSLQIFSKVEKSMFFISGNGNKLIANAIEIINTSISVTGNNNEIIFEKDTKIRNCNIIIRGNGCKILIGNQTTIGGARIINVGTNCLIKIGNKCLFSDNIEIWASDTHSIFDSNNTMINPEKDIIINDNVWIGTHVKILKGVTIGQGCVVGIATLVTKDIPSNTLSVGNPNRVIKEGISWDVNYQIK